MSPAETQVLAAGMLILLIFSMHKLYQWTKSRSPNAEVWGTTFESLTHYVQPQAPLKEPKQEIRKEKRQSGDDKDKNGAS